MNARRKMRIGDWLNGAAILVVGLFLGLAVDGIAELAGTAFWPMAIIIPVLFAGAFLVVLLFDGLVDRIFPSGIKPAAGSRPKERRPIALLLSLPLGIVIGVIGAQFGLSDLLL